MMTFGRHPLLIFRSKWRQHPIDTYFGRDLWLLFPKESFEILAKINDFSEYLLKDLKGCWMQKKFGEINILLYLKYIDYTFVYLFIIVVTFLGQSGVSDINDVTSFRQQIKWEFGINIRDRHLCY